METFVDDPSTRPALQVGLLHTCSLITLNSRRRTPPKLMPDPHRLSRRFKNSVASLEDVVRMYQVVLKVTLLITCSFFS